MFEWKNKKSIIGLDIGSKTTKIVQLRYNGTEKPTLEKCHLIPTGIQDEEFIGNVKEYLQANKLSHVMVASSIDDTSIKIRKVEMPKMPEADLIEAIKWNLRDIVDGDIEEFNVSYSRIEEHEDGDVTKLDLMAYAIKKSAVREHQAVIESLGLQPFFVEPAAVSLASTLERCVGDDSNYRAGIHIGYNNTLFYVIGNGVFVFSRPMVGINLLNQEKDPEHFPQKLAIEIQKSIDTFKVNFKMEDIKYLELSGGGALLENMSEYLTSNLGIKTSILNPFSSLSNFDEHQDVQPALFAQAVGLAYLQP